MTTQKKHAQWHVSLTLLLAYLAVFHTWMVVGEGERIVVTNLMVAALTALLIRANHRGYFLNRWDLAFHACVVLDVGLEGILISVHSGWSFYLCAAGFAAVIGAYRIFLLRHEARTTQ